MPYFEITDGNGITHTVDLLSNDLTDIKAEFKNLKLKKELKKKLKRRFLIMLEYNPIPTNKSQFKEGTQIPSKKE